MRSVDDALDAAPMIFRPMPRYAMLPPSTLFRAFDATASASRGL